MTQQKSEDCMIPQGLRKPVITQGDECLEGGKAVPVNEVLCKLDKACATAEHPKAGGLGANDVVEQGLPDSVAIEAPKAQDHRQANTTATMEELVKQLGVAFDHVASNKGAPGPDKKSIEEVREHLDAILPKLSAELLNGTYQPGCIRRVWIPKASGGERGLGIPNVIDRVVQEATRQVLEPLYEPTFHPSSHGFRPGRSCHTAIAEASEHLLLGYGIVVDLDVEKFYDRVCHQRLLARLAARISDRRILKLISKMLKAKVVMPEGVVMSTEEGLPQGGPLSPLLSNIVLDELDQELARRGHKFVRYADDLNIYVRSERAGQRVMASVAGFLQRRLRLKVNQAKSAVARPEKRHFLGFCLRVDTLCETVEVTLSPRSHERITQRIVELTPRNWGSSMRSCIQRLNAYLKGWFGFFGICTAGTEFTLQRLDAHIRRRLRAIQLKHWKRKRTIARKLVKLGVRFKTAWRRVYAGRKSTWALSHDPAVYRGLRNAYFAARGLVSLADLLRAKLSTMEAPVQG